MLTLTLLLASLAGQDDTGHTWQIVLTGPTIDEDATDRLEIAVRIPGEKEPKIYTAEPEVHHDTTPTAKAKLWADSINALTDTPLRAVAIGPTISFTATGGADARALRIRNASEQRGCEVRKIPPPRPSRPQAQTARLTRDPTTLWLRGSGTGRTHGGLPSGLEFGVIEGEREIVVVLPEPGEAPHVASQLAGGLQARGVEAEVVRGEAGRWGVRLARPWPGVVWGDDDTGLELELDAR